MLIELTLHKLSHFYLVFEIFVQIILVGFKFKVQTLLNQIFKFGSRLFHITIIYYNLIR
jgi:hypothetical protein